MLHRDMLTKVVASICIGWFIFGSIANADESQQCWAEPDKIAILRGSVYYNVLYARSELKAYDEMIALNADFINRFGDTGYALTNLNIMRGEILKFAISAYFFSGMRDYPTDNGDLMDMLDSLQPVDYYTMQVPATLDDLVKCGILDHLPASPYTTGSYLYNLPDTPTAGDVYYLPFTVSRENSFLNEPGLFESNVLIIFDTNYGFNGKLLSDEQMDDEFPGDLSKFIPRGKYNTVCYIYGSDPDSW